MKKYFLGVAVFLVSLLLSSFTSRAHAAAALNTDPTQPLSNKQFTVGYSGITDNCIAIRVNQNGSYVKPTSSTNTGTPCDDSNDNYLSISRRSSDPTSGLIILNGLPAGNYVLSIWSKQVKDNNFDSTLKAKTSISLTVIESNITSTPKPTPILMSCDNRPPQCPASLYPGCIESSTLCASAAPNHSVCAFYETPLSSKLFCASAAGVTPGASPGSCGFDSNDAVVSSCSSGYGAVVQQDTNGENRSCICWPQSLPSPTPILSTDEDAPTPTNVPKLPACATFGGGGDTGPAFRCVEVDTAFGRLNVDGPGIVQSLFGVMLGLGGLVAFLLIIYSGYQLLTSQGNPEKVKVARERLTSAIVGLLFIIFSLVVLQVIGVDILNLPSFGA